MAAQTYGAVKGLEEGAPKAEDTGEAAKCRWEFKVLTWTFAVNHATVTTPLLYASSVLTNEAGQAGNAMLYGATLVCSLFFSTLIYGALGAKTGLSLSMALYTVYVTMFASAALMCSQLDPVLGTCLAGAPLQLPTVLLGSLLGGVGAGVLWTSQGAFFTSVCERVAKSEGKQTAEVTSELAGSFAKVFLYMEALVRASATVITEYMGASYPALFFFMASLGAMSTVAFMVLASSLKQPASSGSLCAKSLAVVEQWSDAKTWLLQCTNLTFGFGAAWLAGYVGRNILTPALSSNFIGFAGALLSAYAGMLAGSFGKLAQQCGKMPVVALGAMSFLLLGIVSYVLPAAGLIDPTQWGWGVVVFYLLMGTGRAVYESTNKAIFADFFPGEKSVGAFANVFVFSTLSSTIAYILGASQQDQSELYLLVAFAALTVPAFKQASMLKERL